jgi:23S rRNA pseudouridine2605 synthase
MAKKLTHPRHRATQLFDVELNKPFVVENVERLLKGIELEDGTSRFEQVEFVKGSPRELGVEVKGGKNQIVRRTFESLGYEVVKLDRVSYAGLTKKDLPRGYYRHLTEKEVAFLKMS